MHRTPQLLGRHGRVLRSRAPATIRTGSCSRAVPPGTHRPATGKVKESAPSEGEQTPYNSSLTERAHPGIVAQSRQPFRMCRPDLRNRKFRFPRPRSPGRSRSLPDADRAGAGSATPHAVPRTRQHSTWRHL
ncbi:hypothetical protein SCOCK_330032 [Actinacidiphila cocklensis]|uniref:Uncharacterized protein n=1 Tax=Actinacidiphila cocklensis TaxID=887465 RepID=A0A9W4DSR1_9ACTN|nr:hypothetical protein SCOCK_330032 [Actinacidiphila cocklensis]